jgi:hypothetical protein
LALMKVVSPLSLPMLFIPLFLLPPLSFVFSWFFSQTLFFHPIWLRACQPCNLTYRRTYATNELWIANPCCFTLLVERDNDMTFSCKINCIINH